MDIIIIAAIARNGVIGRDGRLPWHLKRDIERFKNLTMGHPVIMGRKTYESIPKLFRPLPDRTNIILSRQRREDQLQGVIVARAFQDALDHAAQSQGDDEVFIVGGAEIYKQFLPLADRLYLTHVLAEMAGDAYFPELNLRQWNPMREELTPADNENDFPSLFCVYERKCDGQAHPS